jgi:Predicted AAA-ATPase/PD-(D/E)XK nuclease superfamily
MITGNYLYVDKTRYIYDLFSGGSRYYFLSRPRRFGKSLLISTLKELFSGNQKLFEDLWIGSSDYIWEEYPIIYLDFSIIDHSNVQELKLALSWALLEVADTYGVDISGAPTSGSQLAQLIKRLSAKNRVVVLIDEYDKPLLDNLQDIPRALAIRDFLKNFYDILKGMDVYLRAIFITGVSKFSKTSIFSGINNVNDISLKPESAELLGYTFDEITSYFSDYINDFARSKNISCDEVLKLIQYWYNGYRFSKEDRKVYNPFSVLYALKDKELVNYWFESGTPSFLINLLRDQYKTLETITRVEVSMSSLGTFEVENIPLIPLLFQTGYLTIADYNQETGKFTLDYPNFEVEESFVKYLVATLAQTSIVTVDTAIFKLREALDANDMASFCNHAQILFASIPYTLRIDRESYYHSLFQFLMSLLSIETQSEILTNVGRVDLVIVTKAYIYIFELKCNVGPAVALDQIKEKKYYERYLLKGKHIVLVGLSFITKKHTLGIECIQQDLL